MNSIPLLDALVRDARYAARLLRKSPGFTLTAVATLAVAIAVNTAAFTVIDAVLLRPLPYPAPDRLGLVQTTLAGAGAVQRGTAQHGVTWAVVRDHATTVDRAAFSTWTSGINVVAHQRASFAQQQRVGAGFFAVLGILPALGREFSADEDRRGGPMAAILAHEYWRSALASDPAVVGQTITLRGEPHAIVGVMPPGFHSGVEADLWTPLRPSTDGEGEGENYQVLLRLREGQRWAAADAELQRLSAEILARRPAPAAVTATFSTVPLQSGMTDSLRRPLTIVWLAVGVVLLVACVNLAGLLLARGSRRTREIATRMALGSGRAAVVRQLLVESALLGAAGAALGIALSTLVLDGMSTALELLQIWQPLHLDARAIAVACGLALFSSAVFGIVPALQVTRLDVQRGLASTGARGVAGGASHWPRRILVVAQVALGVVLLVAAALLVRTFVHLRGLDPGFDGTDVLSATVSLQDARYRTAGQVGQLVEPTLHRLRASPGVEAAAVSLGLPYERLLNLGFRQADGPEASDARGRMTSATYVAGDYFSLLRIPVRAGRTFEERDSGAAPGVVIVNEALARQYFAAGPVVGRRIAFAGREREIVGVVGNVQVRPGFGDHGPLAAMPLAYIPLSQANDAFLRLVHGWFSPSFIVRSRGRTADVAPALRAAVDASDPLLPFAQVRAMDEVQAAAIALPRLLMRLLSTLAAAAVVLAALGIHGLIASSVTERTREMGIRLALGASLGAAVRTLAAPGLVLALVGTLIGILAARGTTSVLRAFIWGVSPVDPATYAGVAVGFLVVAALASLVPALRILRVDPALTLRND